MANENDDGSGPKMTIQDVVIRADDWVRATDLAEAAQVTPCFCIDGKKIGRLVKDCGTGCLAVWIAAAMNEARGGPTADDLRATMIPIKGETKN